MTETPFESCGALSVPAFLLETQPEDAPRVILANDRCLDAFALPEQAVLNRTLGEIFEPQSAARLLERLQGWWACEDQSDAQMGVLATVLERRFLITFEPVPDAPRHVLCTCIEAIVEREKSHPRAGSVPRLAQAEQFVALAAHDLRAPLRNISQLVEMLRESLGTPQPKQTGLLDLIDEVATKSNSMVGEILDSVESIHAPSEMSAFDLGLMCRNLCDVLDPLGLHHVHWPEAMVEADRLALQTALRNLLDNALKHGGKSAMSVVVSLDQAPTGQVCLKVSDNGYGFDRQDPLRTENTLGKSGAGYGFAALCRLISSRGGAITLVKGSGGSGGCVAFRLPGRILNVQIRGRRPRIHQRIGQNPPDAIGMTDKD
ncbi:MAG: HAMP domain-containing sensor histidine kinase [Pseudomonadota bacterium]